MTIAVGAKSVFLLKSSFPECEIIRDIQIHILLSIRQPVHFISRTPTSIKLNCVVPEFFFFTKKCIYNIFTVNKRIFLFSFSTIKIECVVLRTPVSSPFSCSSRNATKNFLNKTLISESTNFE